MDSIFTQLRRPITALVVVITVFFGVWALIKLQELRHYGSQIYPSNTIAVSGEGEVFAIPDVAEFTFSVSEEQDTVEAAQSAATEKIAAMLDFLEESGIEERDIKTTNYSIYPRYEYRTTSEPAIYPGYYQPIDQTQVLMGYVVDQSVSVKVRNTEAAGGILTGVGSRGATYVSGLSFTVDDEERYEAEARALAITDAETKAEAIADELGVRLVRVVTFYEESNPPYYPYYDYGYGGDMAVREAAVPQANIPVGENETTSRVTITYEIR